MKDFPWYLQGCPTPTLGRMEESTTATQPNVRLQSAAKVWWEQLYLFWRFWPWKGRGHENEWLARRFPANLGAPTMPPLIRPTPDTPNVKFECLLPVLNSWLISQNQENQNLWLFTNQMSTVSIVVLVNMLICLLFIVGDQMKLNEHVCILGDKIVLVPYQRKHVPRYSYVVFLTVRPHCLQCRALY